MDIKYILPDNSSDFLSQPLYALAIDVHIPNTIAKYIPNKIRREVVNYLHNDILPQLENRKWWHITCSQSRSFVFLHDISETRQIKLNSAETFIKVNNEPIISELEYCSFDHTLFELVTNDEDDESIWLHKPTDIQVVQMFDQKLDPIDVYSHQILQLEHLDEYRTYSFKAVAGVDRLMMSRVRKILNHEWLALQQNEDTLIWGIPPETPNKEIELIDKKLKKIGLKVLLVDNEDRDTILSEVKKDMPPASFAIVTELKKLSFPINLNRRIFWLQKQLDLVNKIDYPEAIELLKYKYIYENIHGYENMLGHETIQTHTSELPHLLSDFFSIRGNRMLDINILSNSLMISIRFAEHRHESSNSLAVRYIEEYERIYNEIKKILNGFV